jgi:para-nitrobenzyl esterase
MKEAPVVDTTLGRVAGFEEDGVEFFLGVPYAEPPVGRLRFAPPRPKEPWPGVLEATSFGPIAPQPPPSPLTSIPGDPNVQSEEGCLTLNVFRPTSREGPLPVMVFIHGGGFVSGASSSQLYDGRYLASKGVVVVTVNYRLGALGFLAHERLRDDRTGACGNWGLLDQACALSFVKDNAAAFGGDPANVTIFGESAGSMSVGVHLTMPQSGSLFDAAIMQSGAPEAIELEAASEVAERFAAAAGLSEVDPEGLRSLAVEQIIKAQSSLNPLELASVTEIVLPFQPVVDGTTVPMHPVRAFLEGRQAAKPIVAGTNRDEMRFFAWGVPALSRVDEQGLRRIVSRTPPRRSIPGLRAPAEVLDWYLGRQAGRPVMEVWSALMTDWVFWVPTLACARAHAAKAPAYLYRFDWTTPFLDGALGACHALELPFVFGTYRNKVIGPFAGAGKPGAGELSEAMQSCWVGFSRDRVPDRSWPSLSEGSQAVFDEGGLRVEWVEEDRMAAWGL